MIGGGGSVWSILETHTKDKAHFCHGWVISGLKQWISVSFQLVSTMALQYTELLLVVGLLAQQHFHPILIKSSR